MHTSNHPTHGRADLKVGFNMAAYGCKHFLLKTYQRFVSTQMAWMEAETA